MTRPVKISNYQAKKDNIPEYIRDLDNDLRQLYTKFQDFIQLNRLNVGTTDNYVSVSATGDLWFAGDATVWDDMKAPVTTTKLAGVRDPDFVQFRDDGAGSTGTYTFQFDKTTEEEVFLILQFPHGYKLGSTIYPHVHWSPIDANAGNVVWGIEYNWQDINDTFGNTTTSTFIAAADGTAYKHQIDGFSSIAGSSISGVSSMFLCRLYRAAGSGSDTYNNDAALLEFDIHYEIDMVGSREALSK